MSKNYYRELIQIIESVCVTTHQRRKMDVFEGIQLASNLIRRQARAGGSIFFIGNGGSAAIASHMAVDYWKNGNIRAFAFNDGALLTCISNDFGYEYVFEKPINMFTKKKDVLIAISSSGSSKNILNAVGAALKKQCKVITLSGFKRNNRLSRLGGINFYVPSGAYSHVEIIHHSICHYILDTLMKRK